jgi:arginine N-succinyltransferase
MSAMLRAARPDDLPSLLRLARQLDTVNLPPDADILRALIARSTASFDRRVPPTQARWLLVLEPRPDHPIVGCSMLIASHGHPTDPHHFFQMETQERHSRSLDRLFVHRLLRFRITYRPHTELGALILDPAWRGRPGRLGKLLSWGRFPLLAEYLDLCHDQIQAEVLPPLERDGGSLFWNWVGARFTGMTYREADRLSRENHEFMQALFPAEPLHLALMPTEVQAVIGAVHPDALGVAAMLEAQGFRRNGHVDPFDGGPHFEARCREIPMVRASRTVPWVPHADPSDPDPRQDGMVSTTAAGAEFRCAWAQASEQARSPEIHTSLGLRLGLTPGRPIRWSPLPEGASA